jgi:hypothetical protein
MSAISIAQNPGLEDAESRRILLLENAWNQAEVKHDMEALNLLLADTFTYTDDDGSFMNRSEWLTHVKNGVDQYEQLGNTAMTVHVYGNAAIVTGEYHEKIKIRKTAVLQSGRFTDIWIKKNGEWKCAASQATLIAH